MKIKYNKKTFPYYILLTLIFVVECHYFNLFKLPDLLEFVIYTNRAKWIAALGIIVSFFCWHNHSKTIKNYKRFFFRYFCTLVVSLLVISFYTTIRYPLNPIITTYGFCCNYLYVFWAIPILYVFETDGTEKLIKLINIICIIMLTVAILQGISYLISGRLLFSNAEDTYINVRDGKARYWFGPFTAIMLIYNLYVLYVRPSNIKREKIQFLFLLLWAVFTVTNGQTRAVLITEIVCCGVILIFGKSKSFKKILVIILIITGIIYLLNSGILDQFINGFSKTGQHGGSTVARLGAIEYYWSCFAKNPFFAISFAGDEYYNLTVHGPGSLVFQTNTVWFDYSDVGIFGELAKLGIFIIPILLWPAIRMLKIASYYFKSNKQQEKSLILSLTTYVLLTSITFIITDNSRVIAFPVVISLFEYIRNNNTKNGVRLI